jgi:hypothetical protein
MIGIPIPDEVDPSQNSREWRVRAEGAARAACVLYDHQDASVWISASLLAHCALEALLKSALLKAGFVILQNTGKWSKIEADQKHALRVCCRKRDDRSEHMTNARNVEIAASIAHAQIKGSGGAHRSEGQSARTCRRFNRGSV